MREAWGSGGRGRKQSCIWPCHVTERAELLPEPSRGWVPKGKVRLFWEHKNTDDALVIELGLSSRSSSSPPRVRVDGYIWAQDGRASTLFHGGKARLRGRTCPSGSALSSQLSAQKVRALNLRGKGQSCFLNMTAIFSLSIVCLAKPATTLLLLFIVYVMSTFDYSLCR